jgi:TctA family transporter
LARSILSLFPLRSLKRGETEGAAKLCNTTKPLALGFILGPSFEEYLRRTLLFSRGDPVVLVQDPVSLGCLLIMAMASLWLTAQTIRQGRAKR